MHQLTAAELTEADSTIIIPADTWDTLPWQVTDVLYGYIGTPVSNGKIDGYRFSHVPQYKVQELLAEWEAWKRGM